MNGMRISGTLPKLPEAKVNCPTCPQTYLPCAMDGHFCMTSPNYPREYDSHQSCKIEIRSNGTITALNFSTQAGDKLSIGNLIYSGTVGPVGVPVQTGTTVHWQSGTDLWKGNGWRLCWSNSSEPAMTQSLRVLSLGRNYINGHTQPLGHGTALETLLIFSNYLDCQSIELESATNLGQGVFQDPTGTIVEQASKVLQGATGSNPFASYIPKTFENTVLAFAGNIEEPPHPTLAAWAF